MCTYKIKSIRHSGSCGMRGEIRTDGFYPLRIGTLCTVPFLEVGEPVLLDYPPDQCGYELPYILRTSRLKAYSETDINLMFETNNSIFELEKLH